MRVFYLTSIVLIALCTIALAGLAFTVPGKALRAELACRDINLSTPSPIFQASRKEQTCLLLRAELAARDIGLGQEVYLRAQLWNGDGPVPGDLTSAAGRVSRSTALSALERAGGPERFVRQAGYNCRTAHPSVADIIDQAMPDARWEICQRLLQQSPPRLNPTAVSAVIPWDGRCPDPMTHGFGPVSLHRVGYAALSGSAQAAQCMSRWAEYAGWLDARDFWIGVGNQLDPGAHPSKPSRLSAELTALVERAVSSQTLSEDDILQIEAYLL